MDRVQELVPWGDRESVCLLGYSDLQGEVLDLLVQQNFLRGRKCPLFAAQYHSLRSRVVLGLRSGHIQEPINE